MVYKKQLGIQQREKKLIEFIKDAKEMDFNDELIQSLESQLKKIQEEIKEDKDRIKKLNSHIIERGES